MVQSSSDEEDDYDTYEDKHDYIDTDNEFDRWRFRTEIQHAPEIEEEDSDEEEHKGIDTDSSVNCLYLSKSCVNEALTFIWYKI